MHRSSQKFVRRTREETSHWIRISSTIIVLRFHEKRAAKTTDTLSECFEFLSGGSQPSFFRFARNLVYIITRKKLDLLSLFFLCALNTSFIVRLARYIQAT